MRKLQSFLIIFVLMSVMLFYCVQKPLPVLRIGTNVWPGYEPLYLSRELGYLDKDFVRLVEYTSATEVLRAYRNGAIEGAALTLDEVLLLVQNGFDPQVVLIMDISNGSDVILGKPKLTSIKDLKNLYVGVESTALGAYMLSRALEISGLSLNEIKLVPLEVNEHERAFVDGKVDAVVTFEPVRSKLLAKGAVKLFDSSQIPNEIVDVLIVRRDYMEKYTEVLTGLLNNWFLSLDYLKKHPHEASKYMMKRLKLTAEECLASLEGLKLPSLEENCSLLLGNPPTLYKSAQNLKNIMLRYSLLEKDLAINQIVNGKLLKKLKDETK